jgi:hypothetical protein
MAVPLVVLMPVSRAVLYVVVGLLAVRAASRTGTSEPVGT